MIGKILKYFIIIILFFNSLTLFSQSDSVYSLALPEIIITQKENGKTVKYYFENEVNFFTLKDSMLIADSSMYSYKLNLANLKSISIRNGRNTGGGALVGGAIGLGLGVLIGAFGIKGGGHPSISLPGSFSNAITTGFFFAAVFGAVGAGIGALMPNYDMHDFNNQSLESKRNKLMNLLVKRK